MNFFGKSVDTGISFEEPVKVKKQSYNAQPKHVQIGIHGYYVQDMASSKHHLVSVALSNAFLIKDLLKFGKCLPGLTTPFPAVGKPYYLDSLKDKAKMANIPAELVSRYGDAAVRSISWAPASVFSLLTAETEELLRDAVNQIYSLEKFGVLTGPGNQQFIPKFKISKPEVVQPAEVPVFQKLLLEVSLMAQKKEDNPNSIDLSETSGPPDLVPLLNPEPEPVEIKQEFPELSSKKRKAEIFKSLDTPTPVLFKDIAEQIEFEEFKKAKHLSLLSSPASCSSSSSSSSSSCFLSTSPGLGVPSSLFDDLVGATKKRGQGRPKRS